MHTNLHSGPLNHGAITKWKAIRTKPKALLQFDNGSSYCQSMLLKNPNQFNSRFCRVARNTNLTCIEFGQLPHSALYYVRHYAQ